VGATDGRGGYLPCVWSGAARLEAAGAVSLSARPTPAIGVGFVPVKGDRPEWAVQKLTELGVDRIVVLSSERAVVRWEGDRLASHLDRLERVARAAVMQSRQVWLPMICGGRSVSEELEAGGAGVAIADRGGPSLGAGVGTVLIGPEGGWTEGERGRAGDRVVGLAPAVLRAETAAVAAGVLLGARRGGLAAPAPGGAGGAGADAGAG
jgi:16S rRNA (uracil1498-N3)-methyltransferase